MFAEHCLPEETMPSLADALKHGRMADFIAHEEARGVGPIDRAKFDSAINHLVKAPPPKDRTSRSSSGDGSSEKKTRRDSGPDASR